MFADPLPRVLSAVGYQITGEAFLVAGCLDQGFHWEITSGLCGGLASQVQEGPLYQVGDWFCLLVVRRLYFPSSFRLTAKLSRKYRDSLHTLAPTQARLHQRQHPAPQGTSLTSDAPTLTRYDHRSPQSTSDSPRWCVVCGLDGCVTTGVHCYRITRNVFGARTSLGSTCSSFLSPRPRRPLISCLSP